VWNNKYGIVMHGMDMDLRQFMATELYDSMTVCDFSRQCARGLHYVHTLDTLHADIKPENIGISVTRKNGERMVIHARILDFGSSKMIQEIEPGMMMCSTFRYQSPEKRQGVFHFPNDIYEMGLVYIEMIEHSTDSDVSNQLYGGLVADMTQHEYRLRPTSQEVLTRLNDPQQRLWERLISIACGGITNESWDDDFAFLVACEDPLTFLMRDLPSRMQYISDLSASDSLQQMEKAFFLLFKTAQREVADFHNIEAHDFSVLQYIHHFHGMVDTTWWTKLFYCVTVHELSALSYFRLEDMIKVKLWLFSAVRVCERYILGVLVRCMDEELFQWCSARKWGEEQTDFTRFLDADVASRLFNE
jgi:serine/threonine protein kinase